MMASNAKDIQLRELKDTISQLKTMISEQFELIRSLHLIIDKKIQSRESAPRTGGLSYQKIFRLFQRKKVR